MNWQSAVERTVTGMGYELVDADKGAGGLLRVFIDHPAQPVDAGGMATYRFITVDDCEKVNRQLQHVLEVEGCAYERLEVSSPGLDRPLKTPSDYARFAGERIELTLKLPFQGRKKFHGELQPLGAGWRLVLETAGASPRRAPKTARVSKVADIGGAQVPAAQEVLDFMLDEVREARLVPMVDFKGRRFAGDFKERRLDGDAAAEAPPVVVEPRSVEVVGGRIR